MTVLRTLSDLLLIPECLEIVRWTFAGKFPPDQLSNLFTVRPISIIQ